MGMEESGAGWLQILVWRFGWLQLGLWFSLVMTGSVDPESWSKLMYQHHVINKIAIAENVRDNILHCHLFFFFFLQLWSSGYRQRGLTQNLWHKFVLHDTNEKIHTFYMTKWWFCAKPHNVGLWGPGYALKHGAFCEPSLPSGNQVCRISRPEKLAWRHVYLIDRGGGGEIPSYSLFLPGTLIWIK